MATRRSAESTPERASRPSALDRVLRAVRAGWSSLDEPSEASVVAQARYARRIGHGDTIVIEGEVWRIVDIVKGDDEAPVIIENGTLHRSVASLDLERVEQAARLIATVDEEPEPPAVTVTPTGTAPGTAIVPPTGTSDPEPVRAKQRFSRRYGAVDISEAVESRSRDVAEEELHREKAELTGVSGFLLRIAKHNIGYELTRQLGINRAREKILRERDVFAHEDGTRQQREAAVGVVVDRFLAEHDEFLHQEGKHGERRKVFGDSPREKAVKKQLNDLVREYAATPMMTEDELNARRDRIFQEAKSLAGDAKGDGVLYADNLKQIAEEVRVAARHAGGIDNLDIDIEFVLGKAKLGARTEHEKGMVDTVLEKMQSWGQRHSSLGAIVGAFRNEISVAVAATVGIGTALARTALSSNAAKLLTFGGSGLVTGLYSWWKEKGRVNRERSLHERQMALGGNVNTNFDDAQLAAIESKRAALTAEYNATSVLRPIKRLELKRQIESLQPTEKPRRATMESFAMARANAKDLTAGGRGFLTPDGSLKPDIDPAFVLQKLAEMDARVRISNAEKVDLLRYSSVVEAEQERRDLDDVRMRLKAALRAAHPDFQEHYDEVYRLTSGVLYEHEESGVKATNEKFAAYAGRRARKVGVTTALIGAGVGYVAHEVWALASNNETVTGSLGRAASWLKGYLLNEPAAPVGAPNVDQIAGGVMTTPHGTEFVPQADGSFTLESTIDHKIIASGIHIDSNGVIDPGSKTMLEDMGATVVERDIVSSHTETVVDRVGTWAWLREHAPDITRIKRILWLDNDTVAPKFDHNEQGLDWGAVSGVGKDGYVMDIRAMVSNGSWHGKTEVDALSEMVEGNMRLVLTMSEGTQNRAVEIVFDANGQATIPFDSDIARTFFTTENGQAVFLGRFAEVALTTGFDEHGIDQLMILATHEGEGLTEGVLAREIGESVTQHVTDIGLPNAVPDLVLPPIIPIRGRTPLERLSPKKGKETGGYYGPYGQRQREMEGIFDVRMSPTLRNNPRAVLDFNQELGWYINHRIDNDPEYAESLIELLSQEGMAEPMTEQCRVAPCIPVYTLGEGKGMEHTLDQYRKQITNGSIQPEEFELVLFLNHPKDRLMKLQADLAAQGLSMDGAEDRVRRGVPEAYDTEEVIRQYQEKYPEMKIRVMKKEFETRPLWGVIIKHLYDAACIRAGRRRNPVHKDIIMLTNDADLRDMSDTYLRTIVAEFDANERAFEEGKATRLDGLSGRGDHDNETYKKWPNFFLATRFEQFLTAQTRSGYTGEDAAQGYAEDGYSGGTTGYGEKYIWTQGRNTALRGSAYCAIGGARTERDAGADTELGDMIRHGRRAPGEVLTEDRYPLKYVNAAWIETDPRRELGMYKQGRPIDQAWNDWDKMDVYGKSFAEQITGDAEELNVDRLQMEMYEFITRRYGLNMESPIVARALAWLGLSGIETNDAGQPIDKDGNVITDKNDSSKFVPYKDYEIGDIAVRQSDGSTRTVRGIKILSLDHVQKKFGAWKPKRERLNNARANAAAKAARASATPQGGLPRIVRRRVAS